MESIIHLLKSSLPDGLQLKTPEGRTAFIERVDPLAFWGEFIGAVENGNSIALMSPGWPTSWRETLINLVGTLPEGGMQKILIPTSGSTGLPKFCIHDLNTLISAAEGFRAYPGIPHAINVLPQYHIGGLMPVFRSACCGGDVHFADYRELDNFTQVSFPLDKASVSLVHTQLRRMREIPGMVALLKQLALILVGGAACPRDLLDWARVEGLRLAPCYGSTETAAMVTMLPPDSFLKGLPGVGTPLPHAEVDILTDGRIAVRAGSLLHGYFPAVQDFQRLPFVTGDLGKIDSLGNLEVLGRADRVIISGGENVHPELVENAAMATGLLVAAKCSGVEDSHWGSRIELWVESIDEDPEVIDKLFSCLNEALPPFARPKSIHLQTDWHLL